jgi:dTDP-4-amino-4,6-dideoxygalactose transaminase
MNELEAAVGIGNLSIYEQILRQRRKNLYYLMRAFKAFSPYLKTIEKESYEEIGPHALPIIIQEKAQFTRSSLVHFMERKGIDTRNLFSSIPTQCGGYEFLNKKIGDFPNAEYIGEKGLHIGVHQDMTQKDCDYVIGVIEEFLKR